MYKYSSILVDFFPKTLEEMVSFLEITESSINVLLRQKFKIIHNSSIISGITRKKQPSAA
jgi:predicted XRE-type DNA-binding protein